MMARRFITKNMVHKESESMQRSWAMKKDRQDKNRLRGNISSAVMLAGAAFVLLFSSSAAAQDRVELTGIFGYTFSEGFETDPGSLVSELIEKVNPTSGYAYGAGIDVFVTEQAQVGFLWTQQDSTRALPDFRYHCRGIYQTRTPGRGRADSVRKRGAHSEAAVAGMG